MGRWTYYSPILIGIIFALLARELLDRAVPREPAWYYWLIVSGAALLFGLQCQILMIGAQGVSAQVLPVPGGRSIRGRAAVGTGWLLLAWFAFVLVGTVLTWEGAGLVATIALCLSLLALLSAVITYIWCWPTALRDFDTSDRFLSAGERPE